MRASKQILSLLLLTLAIGWTAQAQTYYVYVAAESEDQVAVVRFDGEQAEVVKTIEVGTWPTEIEGPHGLTVSPDGAYWYLSIAHGLPFGKVVKYKTGTDEKIGEAELGLFPASMQISAMTGLLYVVNFNLHGKMEPSSVSVVDPEMMIEVARTTTGIMPHGSRLTPDGLKHYSAAMMSGELFEIDALTFEVTRRIHTGTGKATMPAMKADAHTHKPGMTMPMDADAKPPKPTWVQPHPTKPLAYVANNGTDEIVEVDLEQWTITRRFKAEGAPYNLDVSPDGKYLVASLKKGAATGIFDLSTGEQIARIANSRKVTHGVALSPDGRYAFISVEGIGGEPGSVDVIDLQTMTLVATAETGKQAGGIAFWKIDGD